MDKRLKGQPIQPQIVFFIADFTKKNGFGPSKPQAAAKFSDYTRQHIYANIHLLYLKGFLKPHVGTEKRSTMLELKEDWKDLMKKHF